MKLVDHHESYNPPPEFLWSKEKKEEWDNMDAQDRPKNKIMPQKYDCLRHVPAFKEFINERFDRCLDLYLCPRVRKNRLQIDPESLIPPLPKPKDLQPFPTTLSLVYEGHTDKVRSLSVDPTGRWLVTGDTVAARDCDAEPFPSVLGSDDKTVRLWEVSTSRCLQTWVFPEAVTKVVFSPTALVVLVAVLCDKTVTVIGPGCASNEITEATVALVKVWKAFVFFFLTYILFFQECHPKLDRTYQRAGQVVARIGKGDRRGPPVHD